MNENMYAAITGIPAGFKAFVRAMQERLEARYPDCEVRAVQTDKNNSVRLTGIVIMQDGENVTPNIYMEDFYREYLDGRRMEDIEDDAVKLYEGCRAGVMTHTTAAMKPASSYRQPQRSGSAG